MADPVEEARLAKLLQQSDDAEACPICEYPFHRDDESAPGLCPCCGLSKQWRWTLRERKRKHGRHG